MRRLYTLSFLLLLSLAAAPLSAHAELVTYGVNIVQTGPVTVGSTIDWEIFATVSQSDGDNLGIATAAIDLQDSFGETLNPGIVQNGLGQDFSGYVFEQGGVFLEGKLQNIEVTSSSAGPSTVGADPINEGSLGPFLLATGSYTVNTLGLHTLATVSSNSDSRYFSLATGNTVFEGVAFGSDSIMVTSGAAVPEPSSLAMMGLAACGVLGLSWRRRRKAASSHGQAQSA